MKLPAWLYPKLIVVGLLVVLICLSLIMFSDKPDQALVQILTGPVSNKRALGESLASLSMLSLAAVAASLSLRPGLFNLGGEGQAFAGGLAGAWIAILIPGLPQGVAPFVVALMGLCAGCAIGVISGVLKYLWNTDELISTFLLSSAIGPIGHVLLSGPLHDDGSYLIAAPPLPSSFQLAPWLPPSRFGSTVVWTIIALAITWIFFERTQWGYGWRLRGANKNVARYGGIKTARIALLSLMCSGGVYGLVGAFSLLERGQAVQGFTSQLGWDGLAIALIAGSRPAWIVPAALIYVWIKEGTGSAVLQSDFQYALGGVIQGLVFLLITARWYSSKSSSRGLNG